MAKGLRSRALTILLVLAGCGDAPRRPRAAETPRAVDVAAIADAELVAAVLDECHKPLRGHLDRIAADVTLPGNVVVHVFARMPEALRANGPDGQFLLRGDRAWTVGDRAGAPVAAPIRARLEALRTLLDAAALGPLHRATACRRLPDGGFAISAREGTEWTLRLAPGTLLPARLSTGGVDVDVLDHLHTSTTWMVSRASVAPLGACSVSFEIADLAWDEAFFTPPAERAEAGAQKPRIPFAPAGGEARSPVPTLTEQKAMGLVLLDDPGDWPGRTAAYAPVHAELLRQGQAVPGFPMLLRDGDRAVLAAPYRAREGRPELSPPSGWRVRPAPAGRLLVVYPQEGDFAARCAAGEKLLQDTLTAQGLRARGPVVCQPFLHLEEGAPTAAQLAAPVVRVSVAVE